MIMAKTKQEIIKEVAINPKDTGSADVQVSLLTNRIFELTEHLANNPKDHHSRRGLLLMVGRRRRLLRYLALNTPERYSALIKKLGLRK